MQRLLVSGTIGDNVTFQVNGTDYEEGVVIDGTDYVLNTKGGTGLWMSMSVKTQGDLNGDGTDDILFQQDHFYGAWLVQNGSTIGWMGLGDIGSGSVEEIADFNGDGVDDLRIPTETGEIGAQLVLGPDTLEWHSYGSVGEEWKTCLASL